MKRDYKDYRETWWENDSKPKDDEGELSFEYICLVLLMFAGLLALALIGFNF